jgi:uncharacterized membrane protein
MEPFELYREALGALRLLVLAVGVAVIFAGIALAAYDARGTGGGGRVPRQIGSHAALGLEFLVGATILNLVLRPTWTAVATTALTIVVRKLLTFSLGRAEREGRPR